MKGCKHSYFTQTAHICDIPTEFEEVITLPFAYKCTCPGEQSPHKVYNPQNNFSTYIAGVCHTTLRGSAVSNIDGDIPPPPPPSPQPPFPHPDCNKDANEEVELIKVQQARVIHIQHVKHTIDFLTTQVCCTAHENIKLDVCRKRRKW